MAVVAGKTESRTARFRTGPRHGTRQGPGRQKARGPSAGEGRENSPVGCVSAGRRQSRSLRQQSHPARFVAGAETLWRASTHKGSRCSAGGRRHGIPSAQGASSRSRGVRRRKPSWPRQGTPIKGMAAGAIRGAMTFSPVARWRADGARTPLQKETRALESRAVRDVCLAASEVAGAARRRGSGRLGGSAPLARCAASARRGLDRQRAPQSG